MQLLPARDDRQVAGRVAEYIGTGNLVTGALSSCSHTCRADGRRKALNARHPRTIGDVRGCRALEGRKRVRHAGTGRSCSSLRRGLSDDHDGPVWKVGGKMTRMSDITDAAYPALVRCAIAANHTWNGSGRSSGDPSGPRRRSGNRCRSEELRCSTGQTGSNRTGSGCCEKEIGVLRSWWRSPLPASLVTGDTVRNTSSSLYPSIAIILRPVNPI